MAEYDDVAARFARDTKDHEMTVRLDDGLYRHLTFAKPGTFMHWFDLVTWPGNLVIRGDMDDFAFSRHEDMFTFFRGSKGINPSYWAEKVFDRRDATERYSEDAFRRAVAHHVAGNRVLSALVKVEILDAPGLGDEDVARSLLEDFEYDGFRFSDVWEWNFREFTDHFLWCCHAIVHGIQQYDAHKAALVGGGAK
ncbi:hypothetical protein [Streptodolium elevatio]|uniref:Uncharacterized protein n=1 Tax=Streptodolium elevatio TaxID=3157996 RepID=A0ABV3DJW0_9ACTN